MSGRETLLQRFELQRHGADGDGGNGFVVVSGTVSRRIDGFKGEFLVQRTGIARQLWCSKEKVSGFLSFFPFDEAGDVGNIRHFTVWQDEVGFVFADHAVVLTRFFFVQLRDRKSVV